MGMPCILPGHAENVRKCIDANFDLFLMRAMHHDAGSRVGTRIYSSHITLTVWWCLELIRNFSSCRSGAFYHQELS